MTTVAAAALACTTPVAAGGGTHLTAGLQAAAAIGAIGLPCRRTGATLGILAAALVFALPGATSAETVSAQFCRDVLPNILSMAASVEKTPGEFWAVNAKFSIPEQKRFSETRDKGVALAAAAKAYREAVVAACYPPR